MMVVKPDVVVLALLGRNPAPLVELLWALVRKRNFRVARVVVVLAEDAQHYLGSEVLGPGAALDELRSLLGDDVPGPGALDVRVESADALMEAFWQAGLAATSEATPVVFAVAGGIGKALAIGTTTAFTLIGRQRDICVDVRVSSKLAEGGTGFYFPEQSKRYLQVDGKTLDARAVDVECHDIQLPRVRRLIDSGPASSWASAVALFQRGIDAASVPDLVIDLNTGSVSVGGIAVEMAPGRVLWLATLADARVSGKNKGWIASNSDSEFIATVLRTAETEWANRARTRIVRHLLKDEIKGFIYAEHAHADLGKLRQQVRKQLRQFAKKNFPPHQKLLEPQWEQVHDGNPLFRQRLALPPEAIHLTWPS